MDPRAASSGAGANEGAGDWVVELSCGHHQHVRHRPPWESRPWVATAEGRQERIGRRHPCGTCAQATAGLSARARERIASLDLVPHPEGGFYRETYRSAMVLDAATPARKRSASTAIYFLIPRGSFSAFHRILSDEVWHFYEGAPLEVVMLGEGGRSTITLGTDFSKGEVPQGVVPAGIWFASHLANDETGDYALVGCTVAPGFDFEDFEMADREALAALFPEHRAEITSLTRLST
ncbi:MAG: cupin domain-containing protein [Polyangiaceae bacterium]